MEQYSYKPPASTRRFGPLRICAVLGVALGVAGCGGGSSSSPTTPAIVIPPQATVSGFSLATASNTVDATLGRVTRGGFNDFTGVGYAYAGGIDTAGQYLTLSTLLGPALTPPSITGQAQYTGTATAIHASSSEAAPNAVAVNLTSPVSVTADLNTGLFFVQTTPSGAAPLNMTMQGSVQNGQLAGTGSFTGSGGSIPTTMTGKIGNNRAVGAFHGTGTNQAVAGGFYATQ